MRVGSSARKRRPDCAVRWARLATVLFSAAE
jgi:hypothetical protein